MVWETKIEYQKLAAENKKKIFCKIRRLQKAKSQNWIKQRKK